MNEQLTKQISAAFICGAERTLAQDVEFAVDQLVEVAVRALSPGTNDPFTAIRCIDRLGAALCQLTERVIPSPYRYDDTDRLRVITPPVTFAGVADAAFDQIRQYGATSVPVLLSLLQTICKLAGFMRREEHRIVLLEHLHRIHSMFDIAAKTESDHRQLDIRYHEALRAVETAQSRQLA